MIHLIIQGAIVYIVIRIALEHHENKLKIESDSAELTKETNENK